MVGIGVSGIGFGIGVVPDNCQSFNDKFLTGITHCSSWAGRVWCLLQDWRSFLRAKPEMQIAAPSGEEKPNAPAPGALPRAYVQPRR